MRVETKYRVLIVEDEKLTARCLAEDLTEIGVEPLEPVSTGEKALEAAIREKPDLILMDIRLAGVMDGIEAAEIINATRPVPIIFMSGFTQESVREKVGRLNYAIFLEKPVAFECLKSEINQIKKISLSLFDRRGEGNLMVTGS